MTARAIVVVPDGLRRGMVGPAATPALARLAVSGTWFDAHPSVSARVPIVATAPLQPEVTVT